MKHYLLEIVNDIEPVLHGPYVVAMVNGNADPFINLPLSTLQACVKSQVILLNTLHQKGMLR